MKLTIIRGLPGSGKSALAKSMIDDNTEHFESDMFHINDSGEYEFKMSNINKSHDWCNQSCHDALERGKNVVVSNTFVERWEFYPYLAMAISFNAEVKIIECDGDFGSIHGVPAHIIKSMKARWQQKEPAKITAFNFGNHSKNMKAMHDRIKNKQLDN